MNLLSNCRGTRAAYTTRLVLVPRIVRQQLKVPNDSTINEIKKSSVSVPKYFYIRYNGAEWDVFSKSI